MRQKDKLILGNLTNVHIMITSGPTRGYIDAVRYISNKSSGMLGTTIANEALKRGAIVTFLYGTGSIIPDSAPYDKDDANRLTLIEIETIEDLSKTIHKRLKETSFDAIIHAMAVLDYVPAQTERNKISSKVDMLTLTFKKTPKIIKQIRALWPHAFFIGFKLEVGLTKAELIERAYASLIENNLDLVVANDQDTIKGNKHRAYLINKKKDVEALCNTKQEISNALTDRISRK
ncbi:MAG: hypothetical protein MRJ65_03515 [Candidatus Brocadiaceae bacterium]|nr:hypothetical protein [Candidatus Brocadiaceae bacterium]